MKQNPRAKERRIIEPLLSVWAWMGVFIQDRAATRIVPAVVMLWICTTFRAAFAADFSHVVAPILREHCGKCHIGVNKKGGLSFNSRSAMIAGGENGPVMLPGRGRESRLIELVTSHDPDFQMPPQGNRLSDKQVKVLLEWIDEGAVWDEGFVFQRSGYEPPLKPRRPELPAATDGRTNPIDRLLDADLAKRKQPRPGPLDDVSFARRTALDLTGLFPAVEPLQQFMTDTRPDRRERWVRQLLEDEAAYAEHWLTFWNDLLRNDYGGTGFITGGRKQISKWLYQSLVDNKPYDQMVRELIAPNAESAGFSEGIRWRGTVSAGQTVEIQFAQSVGQAFLGINLKCASCHDSFVDRWTLDESYGMAAIFATQPLEIHRCDKPNGRQAEARWLFPELGQIAATAPQPERLKQLAALMTHTDNGRFTRTIVNRLWYHLMGRGIVHPVDAMQTEPWNVDLLDFLAVDFADHQYNLKHTFELIASSAAYQSQAEVIDPQSERQEYAYAGPRAKRLTAEQFMDAVWQITGTAPKTIDAPLIRGKVHRAESGDAALTGQWVWSKSAASTGLPKAGEAVTIRKRFSLAATPIRAGGVVTCDNSCDVFVNRAKVFTSDNWERIEGVVLDSVLRMGDNEVMIVGRNAGIEPNPAAIFGQVVALLPDDSRQTIATDATWEWTSTIPGPDGKFATEPVDWAPVVPAENQTLWSSRVGNDLSAQFNHVALQPRMMVRASLLKSDFLQRTLGRPNRDQIVTTRPNELSTLEAIDLNNTQILADSLTQGARNWLQRSGTLPTTLVQNLFLSILSRPPTIDERSVTIDGLGNQPSEQDVQDLIWALLMQPEFQLVR